ncbi:Transglutaminase-like superfamily protein [Polaribacter sp. KT 15]|nr:Transglutaminase-like superfamily protein [Polaribacter sp. KT 15]
MKMKKVLPLLLLLTTQLSILAQDYKFGKVSKEELEEKFYPLDSTADAAYLFKKRRTYFNYNQSSGFELITKIHERIKVYSKDGFDKATVIIPYYSSDNGKDEKIYGLKAYVFNSNKGKIVKKKLSNKNVFKEKVNDNWNQKKITMPDVKVGSVIDIKYEINSPFYYKIDDLEFQFDIPVKKLDYEVEIPEFYNFKVASKGYYIIRPQLSVENSSIVINSKQRTGVYVSKTTFSQDKIDYKSNRSNFKATYIPALKNNEPFVSNINTYRGGLKYELESTNFVNIGGDFRSYSNSWKQVAKQIYKSSSFGGELSKSSYYKDDLNKILAESKTEVDRLFNIYNFVKQRVKWNEYYGIYSDKGVRKAFKDRVGNVADINLMLTSMLRTSGLNADPVLVSTRANGVPFFPTIDGFNYVISVVELTSGGIVLLDATEPYSTPNILPTRALNWNGRRITKDGNSSWVKLATTKHATEDNNIMVNISDDLMISGLYRTKFSNLSALTYRKNHNHLTEEAVVTGLEEKTNVEIEDIKILNDKNIYKIPTRTIKFNSDGLIESVNGKLYIEPLLFLTERRNPFKLEERKFPVDFTTPWKVKNVVSIKIPEGYKIEAIPESFAIGLPDNLGVFKYQIQENAGKISTISSMQFNTAIVSPQYYESLKKFYGDLVKKQTEKIVLIKI